MSQIHEVKTLASLADLARSWAVPELKFEQAKLVFLDGDMGAGKTSFVSKLADVLLATDAASPSFSLHMRYEGERGIIDHFDLDRLQSVDDLESTGFWDLLREVREDQLNLARRFVMIEWARRLDEFGVGSEGAAWTRDFRSWKFHLEGAPSYRIHVNRL